MALSASGYTAQEEAPISGAANAVCDECALYVIAMSTSATNYGCTEEHNRALRSLFVTTVTSTTPPAELHVNQQHENNTLWTYSDRTGWLCARGVRSSESLRVHLDACAENTLIVFQRQHHVVLPRDALYFTIIPGGIGTHPNL